MALCRFLAAFPQLLRLDLSDNYLVGCLGEVLRSVRSPLEFLSLRYCDVAMADLRDLGDSHHATSIRELNLSKITINQYSVGGVFLAYRISGAVFLLDLHIFVHCQMCRGFFCKNVWSFLGMPGLWSFFLA